LVIKIQKYMSLFYKKLSGLILLSCLVLLLSDCKQSKAKFSKDDVAKSLKIIGIHRYPLSLFGEK
jgi:hypothetical protein